MQLLQNTCNFSGWKALKLTRGNSSLLLTELLERETVVKLLINGACGRNLHTSALSRWYSRAKIGSLSYYLSKLKNCETDMPKKDSLFKNSLLLIAVLRRWSLRLLASFVLRRGSLAPSPQCFNSAFMSTYSSWDTLDSCANYFLILKLIFFFFKEMYAVPKEDIWEMERVKLETCSFAP